MDDVTIVNPLASLVTLRTGNFPSPRRLDAETPDDVCERHQTPDEYQAHERACARMWDALMMPAGAGFHG